ncbi:hypothetical protein [Candidatus Pollutiaquabacter sp.]|uniref:hypothetical protein n=1 Tax=Candidatus Pollutiaquabacter sp. TaxID=3416354 RepID=UPI003CAA69A6|nr:hypothetical protein [Bacteroidota bacterium]
MKFLNSKKSTLYIQLGNEIESNIILAGGRFGSFGFAEGRLACRAKANVPNVGWLKLNLKMCSGENKKYRRVGLSVGFLLVGL